MRLNYFIYTRYQHITEYVEFTMSLVHLFKNELACITEAPLKRHLNWLQHPISKFYRISGTLKWDVDNW